MASVVYLPTLAKIFRGEINMSTAVFRELLLDGLTTTPDDSDHEFVSDIAADEMADASYSRKTLTFTGVGGQANAFVENPAQNRLEFHHDSISHPALSNGGVSVKMIVHAIQVGGDDTTPGDDPLWSCHDTADTTPDGTEFRLLVGSSGSVHGNL